MWNHEVQAPEFPCQIDYTDPTQCMQRFLDLLNIGTMLYDDVDAELSKHRIKLREAGWDEIHIQNFQSWALCQTIWEDQIPRRIRELGNQRIYRDIKERSK